ncbi:MAG: hypothetical protein NTY14_00440 [Candidatus Omnitrophica bacterium]|nr:hypothetical protein [Candidatus Omnitrophota bacterium]
MARVLPFFIFCVLSVTAVCFGQFNQTESLTVTTYYLAPYSVFRNLQLSPSTKPFDGPNLEKAGTMYFNSSENKPYIFDGNVWEKIGSGSAHFESGSEFPGQCNGTVSDKVYNHDQLCSGSWYKDIVFNQPFAGLVHVMVVLSRVPDNAHSPCAGNVTDRWIGYPENITNTGFRLWASGSVMHHATTSLDTCNDATGTYDNWSTRAAVNWFAVSE